MIAYFSVPGCPNGHGPMRYSNLIGLPNDWFCPICEGAQMAKDVIESTFGKVLP